MALPRCNRLKHRWDFNAVYRYGKRLSTQHLYVRALGSSATSADRLESTPGKLSPTLIGISISQKVSKRAVIRNRIKRHIRAALRPLLPRMRKGWRVVIVGRPHVVQCEYRQFLQELEQSLADLEVIDGY